MPDLGETRDRTIEIFFAEDAVRQLPQRSSGDELILAKWQITNIKSGDVQWHVDQSWTTFLGEVDSGDFARYGTFTSDDGIDWNEFSTRNFNSTTFTPQADNVHGTSIFGNELFLAVGGRANAADSAPGRVKDALSLWRISLPIGNTIKRIL